MDSADAESGPMIFRKNRRKRVPVLTKHLRLRVESCVNTILELNVRLGEGKIKPEIIQQFERLKDSLQYVRDDSVDEEDIDRIEEATNQLLAEIRTTYGETLTVPSRGGQTH